MQVRMPTMSLVLALTFSATGSAFATSLPRHVAHSGLMAVQHRVAKSAVASTSGDALQKASYHPSFVHVY